MLKYFKHFKNYKAENIYIHGNIVYNRKDKMVKYARYGILYILTDEFEENPSVKRCLI